ncbi:MAG TPA: hypothetical protein PLJ62_13870 [Thermoflexales bacterium]|nr:hypothetical protein [Thermoflexales bacterium]
MEADTLATKLVSGAGVGVGSGGVAVGNIGVAVGYTVINGVKGMGVLGAEHAANTKENTKPLFNNFF